MKTDGIHHYRKNAIELAGRYESADVTRLQMDLRDAMTRRERVLELGCGSGRDAAFLVRHGGIGGLTATDGSPEMLREALKLHPELQGCLEELIFPEGLAGLARAGRRYSGIYSIAALMHLSADDIAETARQLELITEPGGILFISVCTERDTPPSGDHRPFTLKPAEWWRSIFQEAGFRMVEMKITTDGLDRQNTSWLNMTMVL